MTDPVVTDQSAEVRDPSQYASFSSLTLHRTCPQAWSYRYIRGLSRPAETVRPEADFGSWWHALRDAEAMQRGREMGSLRFTPRTISTGDDGVVFERVGDADDKHPSVVYRIKFRGIEVSGPAPLTEEAVLTAAASYWNSLPTDAKELWQERLGPLVERLTYVNDRWHEVYADDLAHEAPLGIEVKFKRPLPESPNGGVLPGYVDLVYLDTRRNLTVVRDSKTGKSLSSTDTADDLMDSQLHVYAWGAAPLVKEWGYSINALSYDRVRSVAPKMPTLTQSGSLSKSVTDYDLHTYLTWAAGPDGDGIPWGEPDTFVGSGPRKGTPKWGLYTAEESVVERLSTQAARSAWFQRTLVPLNRNVIRAHLRAAVDTQRAQSETVTRYAVTAEAPRNFTRNGCRWCDFAPLCRAEMMGGPGGDYPLQDYGLVERGK